MLSRKLAGYVDLKTPSLRYLFNISYPEDERGVGAGHGRPVRIRDGEAALKRTSH